MTKTVPLYSLSYGELWPQHTVISSVCKYVLYDFTNVVAFTINYINILLQNILLFLYNTYLNILKNIEDGAVVNATYV